MLTNNQMGTPVKPDESRSIYVNDSDRYIVSMVVGYSHDDKVTSPEQAAAAALALTRDAGSDGTVWFVFDRKTGDHHVLDQRDFEEIIFSRGMI